MQTFHRAGLAPERDAIGAELVALSARHGLVTFEVLGHLIRLQARSALADFAAADAHAAAADRLAERHELPLVARVHRVVPRRCAWRPRATQPRRPTGRPPRGSTAPACPACEHGLLPLALLCLRLREGAPLRDDDWGPYEPWARPLVPRARAEAEAARRCAGPEPTA